MSDMAYTIRRFADAASFLARAEAFLLTREAEHNLLLGLAYRLLETTSGYEPPIYLATVERDGEVVGCAFRTPPFKLGLTRTPAAALAPLADDVAAVYAKLPAVLAPEPEARGFAERWSALRGTAGGMGMRQRLYRLDRLVPPAEPVPGRMRVAEEMDVPLVAEWLAAFSAEAHTKPSAARPAAEDRVARRVVHLWDDGGPRSLAGWAARTPHGMRIGPVYTPPEWRGRGYASAVTAAATRRALDAGCRFCILYTDLSNPTSNAIYQRLGYEPVMDVLDWRLDGPAT